MRPMVLPPTSRAYSKARSTLGEFPDAEIHVCAVDQQLNSDKYIVPGLGDAGDRTFNTLGH